MRRNGPDRGASEVTPGDHQRILQGVLGPIDVAEDPVREREEPVAGRADEVDECRLVAALGRLDEGGSRSTTASLTSIGDVVRESR